jgi:hypothetical protein
MIARIDWKRTAERAATFDYIKCNGIAYDPTAAAASVFDPGCGLFGTFHPLA